MKRSKSPVFKSVKNCKNEQKIVASGVSQKISENIGSLSSRKSSQNCTQESNFTTQNSPCFKARIEGKLLQDVLPQTARGVWQRHNLEISQASISSSFQMGPFFGLASKVKNLIFQYKKIEKLYEWQECCLKEALGQRNLLIALPTSSGKTLVAEVLMLRTLLLQQKNCIFILPYVSLVQEKVRDLCSLAIELSFVVEEYAASKGTFPPKMRRKRNTIYVATIEKANRLVESLIETERLSEIGLVVIDEIHMLSESGGRGAKLESAITKLKHFANFIHLVAMSATVGNLDELATFLNATLYKGGFRPVPLTQYMKLEDNVVVINSKAQMEEDLFEEDSAIKVTPIKALSKVDPDMITTLVKEVVPNHSCLIFCPTKSNTQAVAKMLCSCLPKSLLQWLTVPKMSLMTAIKEEGNGKICNVLRKTIPFGIAYHHSGLTEGEKKLIEEAFIMGTLCCIVCTSTLAAGINLPARRVIIRAPYIGREFLTRSRYHQMIGRAGRAGLDSVGESFLITSPKDLCKVKEFLLSPIENCTSRLAENDSKGLTDLIFSMIGLGFLTVPTKVFDFVDSTLLALQASALDINLHEEVSRVIGNLRQQGLLQSKRTKLSMNEKRESCEEVCGLEDSQSLVVCRIGKAAMKGSVDLQWANQLYSDLMEARSNLAVHSHLHLLYLVIPYNSSVNLSFNPETFSHFYNKLTTEEKEIAYLLGITDARAVTIRRGNNPKGLDQMVLQRFYVALLLHKVLGGEDIWGMSAEFDVHRGTIQQLLLATTSFAHSVLFFCQELEELWAFRDLLSSFSKTLSISSCSEVMDLLELPTVKLGRAKLLHRAGYKSISDIAKANPQQIVSKMEHISYKVARQIVNAAKMLLFEKMNTLQEEAEDMLKSLVPS